MMVSRALFLQVCLLCLEICMVHSKKYENQVLLVSMSGFRWEYLDSIDTPNYHEFAKQGIRAQYMYSSYPTKTFPSQYTIATGLFTESHGITDNDMFDPLFNATFTKSTKETRWWDAGEPIWVTAKKQGLKAGSYFWPGSDVEIQDIRPDIWFPDNVDVPFSERVDSVMDWFQNRNISLATVYFHEPDITGHRYGVNSSEIRERVKEMDGILGYLMEQLKETGLEDEINVIVVSDHGMTDVDVVERVVDISDYIDMNMVQKVPSLGAMAQILPVPGALDDIVRNLTEVQNITVYKKENVPGRFHYQDNVWIMPVVIEADEGWLITTNKTEQAASTLKATHGYDYELPSMRSIFFARGPNFKKGTVVDALHSVDVYPLICQLLEIQPAPNNGSLNIVGTGIQETVPAASHGIQVSPYPFMAWLNMIILICARYF